MSLKIADKPIRVAPPAKEVEWGGVPEEVVFHNRQALGDIMMMTCGVRDFKKAFPDTRVGVLTTAMHLWDHNPYVDHFFKSEEKVLKIGPSFLTNKSNTCNLHFANAFRIDMEQKLKISIPQGPIKPDIWMTEEEFNAPPLIKGHYWVVVIGGEPGWTAKMWPAERWQEVINLLKGKIQFVQLGLSKHTETWPDRYPRLNNVIDYVGKTEEKHTGLRKLFNIFLHAQGSLGLVSMHMHLSAALENPCVVVAGAREPAWFTQYFGHQYLQTNACLPCAEKKACWYCDVSRCGDLQAMLWLQHNEPDLFKQVKERIKKSEGKLKASDVVEDLCSDNLKFIIPTANRERGLPKCVDIIHPKEVALSVVKYYKGSRLKLREKKEITFENVVRERRIFPVPQPGGLNHQIEKFGFQWNNGAISETDWMFLKNVIEMFHVKTVLEFGIGLSTLLFMNEVERVISYETKNSWIEEIQLFVNDKVEFRRWDADAAIDYTGPKFDLAFVDGPPGGDSREWSFIGAVTHSDLVVAHDASRATEKEWQEKHLKPDFDFIAKGGQRCHLWKRKEPRPREERLCIPKSVPVRPLARMVTTCRGFGGSERSSLYIMQGLIDQGYNVRLHPTSKICTPYREAIPVGVAISDWDAVMNPCDLLVMYCSDTIWNFKNPPYTQFEGRLEADRKVMILNYQLGGAGNVEWTKDWDLYMFLNSTKEREFLERMPDATTKVLPPPTDLTEFFKVKPDYSGSIRLIRHNSQRDAKHPHYTNEMIEQIWRIDPDIEFYMMPARSDTMDHPNIHKFRVNEIPIPEFLSKGNVFFYHLPPNYQDQGPRVILEAMACGLPVMADNRYGARDRVTGLTGWLCDTLDDYMTVIRSLTTSSIRDKGECAKTLARNRFIPERWIGAINGNE